ncbi:PKD domain-containing protein [Nafulsella turpanensis]|uniref:PKD domain-containing protein n=1 Tax=Nafulsella turpanensis TaxID=1265690 RepID=UPI000344EF2A|nr:malectin domain-containing carbohydrate-binding protein [Nafulsella turpanensis]
MKVRKSNFVWSTLALILGFSFLLSFSVQAQDCGCNHVIEVGTTHIDGSAMGIKPGDVVCLKAGKRTNLYIKNLKGSASDYITIKNCGGQVVLGGSTINNGILVQNSRYFRITGTGDSAFEYGIKVDRTKEGSQGIAVTEFSSDVEIDHVEITGAGFAGIMAKTDPKCDGSADRGKFTMYNVNIHDNYIHDVGGEGIYLGNSFFSGTSVYCNKTQYPHEIKGVRVYNNIITRTGWDAIQVGSATSDVEIYDNKIYDYATANRDMHKSAIQLGLGTTGKCYNNFIKNGSGEGIVIQGIGNNLVYNNIISGAGMPAFNVNVRPTPLSSDVVSRGFLGGVYIINNTVIDSKNKGAINEYVNEASNNVFYNNLLVTGTSSWNQLKTYTDWNVDKNTVVKSAADAKFVNASADDYRLTEGSPAVNAGKDISSYGISLDWDRKSRKAGSTTDAGVSELSSTSAPVNQAPTVKAGADQTITLPTASASFTASAADSDGSIASYSWTKVSGPTTSLNGTSTQTLKAGNLLEGSYTFKVTVKDNSGASSSDQVNLTVLPAPTDDTSSESANTSESDQNDSSTGTNAAPSVNAGTDKSIQLPTNTITLTGTASDSDGSIASYLWSKISGPDAMMNGGNTHTLSVEQLVAGTYTFRFRATDNDGNSTSDDINVTVTSATSGGTTDSGSTDSSENTGESNTGGSTAPVANAGADKTVQLPLDFLLLEATASDSDGKVVSYLWSKINGPDVMMNGGNTSTLNLSLLNAGTYTFRFRATDNDGNSTSDDINVTVTSATSGGTTDGGTTNLVPLVKASDDKTIQLPENSIQLTVTAKDEDGVITSYKWTKQSGPSTNMSGTTTANLNLSNLLEGTYIFRITATDNLGAQAYDEVKLSVLKEAAGNVAPKVTAGTDQILTLPTNSLTLSATASDSDGHISSYQWSKTSGPSANLSGTSSAKLSLSNLVEGTYTFRVTVKDNGSATAYDDVMVQVKAGSSTVTTTSTSYKPIYRINAGGNDVSASPIQWENDTRENPSQYLSTSSSNNSAGSNSWRGVNNTDAPDAIFGPVRFDFNWVGPVQYAFPVKSGTYQVRLYFAETPYSGGVSAAGERVFDVKVEGQTKVSGLDIYKEAGMNALQKTVDISVTDGKLNIELVRRIGNPQINGIEIVPVASTTNARTASFDTKEEIEPAQSLAVYPNPVQDQLNVKFGKEISTSAEVQLISMNGTVLMHEQLKDAKGSTEASFDVSQLNMSAGIYLLKVQADGEEAQVVKVLKQ